MLVFCLLAASTHLQSLPVTHVDSVVFLRLIYYFSLFSKFWDEYWPCLVSRWRRSLHGFSASFASTSKQSTQTGKGLFSGPKLVNPSDRYSVEYFLRTFFFVFRDSLSEDSLVAFDSSAFLFPPLHCTIFHTNFEVAYCVNQDFPPLTRYKTRHGSKIGQIKE